MSITPIPPTDPTSTKWTSWSCDEITPSLCPLDIDEGYISVRGIKVKYWRYRAVSPPPPPSPSPSSSPLLYPIITLHGGPAFTHNYILPLKQQACRGRDVIFYDQAGCGASPLPHPAPTSIDQLNETYPWLLDPLYYATEELPLLITHLNYTHYHLLGSSWGTALAQLFYIHASSTTQGTALQSMVLSGPFSDSQLYIQSQWDECDGSLGGLPPFVQDRIKSLQSSDTYDTAEYEAIAATLTSFFTVRTSPAPDCFDRTLDEANLLIYEGMQGPSEFGISGSLEYFNTTGQLKEIIVPVLLTSGRYDTMRPKVVDVMEQELPIVERVMFEKSGHCSMIDEPGKMNDVIGDFYDRVEMKLVGPAETLTMAVAVVHGKIFTTSIGRLFFVGSFYSVGVAIVAFVFGVVLGAYYFRARRYHSGYQQYQPIQETIIS